MLTRGDKRRSATEISISAPLEAPPSPAPSSSQPSSQSLDGQHLLHLVRTNDDLTQQLIAKSNALVSLSVSRSFIHSFIHSFVRSFVRSFIHSFMHSYFLSFFLSFVGSFVYKCATETYIAPLQGYY